MAKKKVYTVFGLYADNQQPWAHEGKGTTPREAAIDAINSLYDDGKNGAELEDMAVVDVIEGSHKGVLGNDVVVTLDNLKDKKCPWLN